MTVIEQLKALSEDRFLAIYTSLEQDGFGPLDGEVARALKFRPQAIRKLPMDQRARRAKVLLERKNQADLAYELLGSYLMRSCKGLVTGFLDATGVKHDDGMIESVELSKPDPSKLAQTVSELDKEFPAEDVTLYLALAAEQWPGVPEIDSIWKMR